MRKTLAVVALALSLGACGINQTDAMRAIEAMGMTNVTFTGYRFNGCGRDDTRHEGFAATGVNGQPVTGVVCSGIGWGKGITVRFD